MSFALSLPSASSASLIASVQAGPVSFIRLASRLSTTMKPHVHASHASAASRSAAIRTIALFEAFKGMVVLLAASGLLSLIHKDVQVISAKFIEHMHLNPASHYPSIFLDATSNLHDKRLVFLAAGAGAYALVRFSVAYGLYAEKAWAEVLTAVSGAIYVPFELVKLVRMPTWHSALFLTINLLIVTFMIVALLQRRKKAGPDPASASTPLGPGPK